MKTGGNVYSGGVGKDISFEKALIKLFDAEIFLFDPSPTGIETMENIHEPKIHFFPLGLARKKATRYFESPDNLEEGSYKISKKVKFEFPCTSVSDFFKYKKHKKIDLLKLDIEGFEYGVLEDIFSNKIPIDQIVLEFHGWMKGIPKKRDRIAKKHLKKNGYKLVYKKNDDHTYVKESLI